MLNQVDDILVVMLLYSSAKFNTNQNLRLLSASIKIISKSEGFSVSVS